VNSVQQPATFTAVKVCRRPGCQRRSAPLLLGVLSEDLFLEGFTISASHVEIAFDFGELDMIVIRTDLDGHCLSVSLCP
jgi:hypothetical protein